ncbi:MAG: gamma-glutamylcyclotransferase family protein, partial [Clostridium sp.]|uniref:gamma-glutamylcyclotransferase family protein n=1 Tax=Clostridium sp. TaxID=1506 RepID=UPI003EE7D0B0
GKVKGFDMYDTGYGFPCIIKGEGEIEVEVYEVKYSIVEMKLDILEGYEPNSSDNLYNKEVVNVTMEDGRRIAGYIYTWNGEVDCMNKIESGDWKEWLDLK